MPDTIIRDLLRRWRDEGDINAKVALINEQLRTGELSRNNVLLAAAYNDEASIRVLEFKPTVQDLLFPRNFIQDEYQTKDFELSLERYIIEPSKEIVRKV